MIFPAWLGQGTTHMDPWDPMSWANPHDTQPRQTPVDVVGD